jgi:membrane-associated protein
MAELTPILPLFLMYGYVALFVLVYLGWVYIPVPSNLALIGAGMLSHITQNGLHFNIFIAAAVALIAGVLGDISGYFVARQFGNETRQKKFEEKHTSYKKLLKYLQSHTLLTVGVSRLIGFASPLINSLAGFSKTSVRVFLLGDILGNIAYVAVYMGLGFFIGDASSNTFSFIGVIIGGFIVFLSFYAGIYILFIRDSK